MLRTLRDVLSRQAERPSDHDFLEKLTEEEEKVLGKHWPEARPSGDGVEQLDQRMQIRLNRWRWRSRVATGGEIVWLLGKIGGLVICLGYAWQHVVM